MMAEKGTDEWLRAIRADRRLNGSVTVAAEALVEWVNGGDPTTRKGVNRHVLGKGIAQLMKLGYVSNEATLILAIPEEKKGMMA